MQYIIIYTSQEKYLISPSARYDQVILDYTYVA